MTQTRKRPGQWHPGHSQKNNPDEGTFEDNHTPPYGDMPQPTGYWVLSPSLVSICPAPTLRFLADLADEFGTTSSEDGSTTISFAYRHRDVSAHVARHLGAADRTVDRRLREVRALDGVQLAYASSWDRLTITLPAVEGSRRPQIPKNAGGLSGRALLCWAALQVSPRDVSRGYLASSIGCSVDTIDRAHTELVNAGYVASLPNEGKSSERVLVGLVRAVPGHEPTCRKSGAQTDQTLRRSGAQPSAEVAPIPLPKQRSNKQPLVDASFRESLTVTERTSAIGQIANLRA